MRLWSLHPEYLDPQGLVALWRESLLAQAVIKGDTRGYRHHPQLDRFKAQDAPLAAVRSYLRSVHDESVARGYAFDRSRIGPARPAAPIQVTSGQLEHEWRHLLKKLRERSPKLHRQWRTLSSPRCHPLFRVIPGAIESWER